MKLSIVIPCLNEADTIERVINEAYSAGKKYAKGGFEIIVADNGSTDGSQKKINKQGLAKVITVPVKGYGAALHWGIMNAVGEYVLFADADLSYPFDEMKKFIPEINNRSDLVLGSRLIGVIEPGAMPWLNRRVGTPMLTGLINLIYGFNTTDCNSGMRMVRRDFYRELYMKNAGMEWASELLIKTALKKGRYKEVPIRFNKDQRNRAPHLSRWSDGWRHLKAIVLLKPTILLWLTGGLFAVSLWWRNRSPDLAILAGLMAVMLFFSYLAAKVLYFAINKQADETATEVIKFPGVMTALIITLAGGGVLGWTDESFQGKAVLAGTIALFDMWVFLIETIKTHLVNRLPDRAE